MTTSLDSQQLNVFTYGSLMYRDIFQAVTRSNPRCETAIARGWIRHGLANRTYPGALASERASDFIEGVLWCGLSKQALQLLDQFEGPEYQRVTIEVTTQVDAQYQAQIYAWLLPEQVQGSWDAAHFEQHHRQYFARIHGARQG